MTRVAAQTGPGEDERALALRVAEWVSTVTFGDLPPDVVAATPSDAAVCSATYGDTADAP